MDATFTRDDILHALEASTHLGVWRLDAATGSFLCSHYVESVLLEGSGDAFGSLRRLFGSVIDLQGDDHVGAFLHHFASTDSISFSCELTDRQGRYRMLKIVGTKKPDQQGGVEAFLGTIQDVSEEHSRYARLKESQRLLESASTLSSIGYWRFDLIDETLYWSDEVYRIHGYDPAETRVDLATAIACYHPEDVREVEGVIGRSIAAKRPFEHEGRIVRPDGETRYVRSRGQFNDEDHQDAMFGIVQDITDQVRAEETSVLWDYLVNETPEAIVITDRHGNTQWVNRAFENLTGYRLAEVIGRSPGYVLQGPDTDSETVQRLSEAVAAGESISVEILNYTKVGEPYWVLISIFPRFDHAGDVAQFMAIEVDISDRKASETALAQQQADLQRLNFQLSRQKAAAEELVSKEAQARAKLEEEVRRSQQLQEQLRKQASSDELTCALNRRYFMRRATSEFTRAQRYGSPLHVVMLDIDRFKSINDQYGHSTGDRVIVTVANVVAASLRDHVDLFGRLGGEEFCFLLPETNETEAVSVANRIRRAVQSESIDGKIQVTCSMGIAFANDAPDLDAVLAQADQALYRAKNSGRNLVSYFASSKAATGG